MNFALEVLRSKKLSCLSHFELTPFHEVLPTSWNTGDSFITNKISCLCGSVEGRLLVNQVKETKGVFKKKITCQNTSPIYFECSRCNSKELLFSSHIHGWNGEMEKGLMPDVGSVVYVSDKVGNVIVNYSYQGIENYEELIEDKEISNPQDYFDTFSVYFKDSSGLIVEVITDECA